MISYFVHLNPVYQALLAGLFTFFITLLGSSLVFFFKSVHKFIMDIFLSLSAGIMLSASYFSLLNPAIEIANSFSYITWSVIFFGFFVGGLFLYLSDLLLEFLFRRSQDQISKLKRCIMLFGSITFHNIPEGLVLGVSYGSIIYHFQNSSLLAAIFLTIGIAIQNFPEGCAISLPLRREGVSPFYSFLFGSLSALVEPFFAVIGALLVLKVQSLLPIIMSFTAGAMIFVTCMELIPECQNNSKKGLMTLFIVIGFCIMMILELLLS